MHQALDDPRVWKVVGLKSAQVAWTDGVLLNYIGRRIDIEPCPMIIMFSKEGMAKKFEREKLVPMIEVTPSLADKVPVHKVRDRNNAWDYKGFPGGFLNLVGSNSPDGVKSTPAPVVCVEEPDDSNTNVREQGDTITLLEERTKTYARRKIIFGGTPTIEGVSRIHAAFKGSDQRHFWVPCPHCDEPQTLAWAQVKWTSSPALNHETFGQAQPETARYCCAHCQALWTDAEKNRAVRKGEWRAAAAFHGVAGFAINELYSPFPGSVMARLVEKRLTAEHALAQGDDTKIRSFRNNTEGLPYAYKTTVPSADKLRDRAESYAQLTVPHGACVLTIGVDVQHDRLAVIIRAWGRGEESWLVWWGEIHGRTMIVKWGDDGRLDQVESGAWYDLDQMITGAYPHDSGASLRIRAGTVDSGDGQTQDAVYAYVRRRGQHGLMAGKGESHDPKKDIFTPPKLAVDMNGKHRPHPSGVKPYMVGTQVAKDLLLGVDEQGGRIKLLGRGPGRMHWYREGLRPDYYDQLTAEVKVPHKTIRGRLVWQCLAGRRNEVLDCEVLALHAARSAKLYLWREDRWTAEEAALQQPALFGDTAAPAVRLIDAMRLAQAAVRTSAPDTPPADLPAQASEEGTADKPVPGQLETATNPAAPKPRPQPRRASVSNALGATRPGWSAKKW